MRWICSLAAAASAGVAPVMAQPVPWIQQACVPTSNHLRDVEFVTAQRGFIVGNNRVLLRTEDAGATWTRESEGPAGSDPYDGIVFHEDGLHGYLHGNVNARTVDGGVTWQPMPSLPYGSWWQADFAASAATAFFGANGAMAFTPDAGVTWEIRSGYPHCPIVESMDFIDDNLGLVTGRRLQPYDEGMYRTADGGRTWTRVYESVARGVRWTGPTTAEAFTADGTIRSEDAGLTWQIVGFFPAPPGTADYEDLGEGVFVAVTGLGEIHKSWDGGFNWIRVYGPLAELPDEAWSMTRAPDGTLWVVGKYGFILRSGDAGDTWTQASSGMGLVVGDLEMFSDTFGMAAGGHGYLWRTTDGGRKWVVRKLIENPVIFGRSEGLSTVDIVDDQFAVAAGAGGIMFRTWDGGTTWENIGHPALDGGLGITDVCFLDRDNGFMLAGGLYRTYSAGSFWEPVAGVTGDQMHFSDALRGWILSGSQVRRTVDGGQTWLTSTLPGEPLVIEGMTWASPTTGWVVGRFGYCAKTVNGGASWQLQNIGGAGNSLFDAAARSATEVWGVGYDDSYNNIIMRSLNGGASWTKWTHNNGVQTLDHIRRRPDGGLHIAGFFGLMLTDRLPRDCAADWNADQSVNSSDISAFLTSWLAGVQGGGTETDVNADGAVNSSDISAFLAAWLAASLAGGC